MKHITLLASVIFCFSSSFATIHDDRTIYSNISPSSEYYTGTGSESTNVINYRDIAKKKALADLISEIEIKISQHSILTRMENNYKYSENYLNEIVSNAEAWIEGYELVDSWTDQGRYFVKYRLNKAKYAQIIQARYVKAKNEALNFYTRGLTAKQNGLYNEALLMFLSGINVIAPMANESFETIYKNKPINLGVELLSSLSNLFFSLSITTKKSQVNAIPYSDSVELIPIYASIDGTPISGLHLSIDFPEQQGTAVINNVTNSHGETDLRLSNITAKPSIKQLKISPVINYPLSNSSDITKNIFNHLHQSIKPITLTITTQGTDLSAYITTNEDTNSPIYSRIKSFLSENYFKITDDKQNADLWIDINTKFNHSGVIRQTLGNVDDYTASCTVTVFNLNDPDSPEIINVAILNHHSLFSTDNSYTSAKQNALREIAQPILTKLDNQLREAKINRKNKASTQSSNHNEFDSIPSDF